MARSSVAFLTPTCGTPLPSIVVGKLVTGPAFTGWSTRMIRSC